jgi:hypothetical protein
MIDKLELRLPALSLFRPAVREFMLESRHFKNSSRTNGSGRYEWVTDTRPVGIDALLHFGLKRQENDPHEGEHKLESLDTGKKGYSVLVAQIEGTVEGAINDLEIMRIDLCADLHGIPVEWFLGRARVKYKRIAHEIGVQKWQRIGKAGIQTLSAGKRPNMVRFYDKVAEYEDQLRRLQRKRSRDAEGLTLEGEFGVSEDAVITRVERQFGGHRIPVLIDCIGRLSRLPEFNPFTSVEICNGNGARVPTIPECGLDMWLAGTRLCQLQNEMGEQLFHRWLSANSSGNASRYRKRYSDFVNPDRDIIVTAQTIFETYRESVVKQLAT